MDQSSGGESLRIEAPWEPRSFTEPLDLLQDRVEAWIKAKEAKLESRQLGRSRTAPSGPHDSYFFLLTSCLRYPASRWHQGQSVYDGELRPEDGR